MIVDCHSTFYPKDFVRELMKRKSEPRVVVTDDGRRLIVEKGVFYSHIIEPQHNEPEARIKSMDRYGIDVQVLSPSAPGYDRFEPEVGIRLAQNHNDVVAKICEEYPDRFIATAALPLQDVEASLMELERAIEDLGLKGVCFFSNNAGNLMGDQVFYPLYKKIERYDVPIFLHPNVPLTHELMRNAEIPPPILGFTFDTTMTIASLCFSGVLEKFDLKIITSHTGGTAPFLAHRFDSSYTAFRGITGWSLESKPSDSLKRLYYDTCSFYPPAIMCTYNLTGSKHILLGTDYPHLIGGIDRAVEIVQNLPLSEQEKMDILGGNAIRLFGID